MASKYCEKNVGTLGRAARIGTGVFLLSMIFWGPHTLWGLVGLVPLATGLAARCPLYPVLGIKGCPSKAD